MVVNFQLMFLLLLACSEPSGGDGVLLSLLVLRFRTLVRVYWHHNLFSVLWRDGQEVLTLTNR